jgi:hypothetical protein
MVDKDAAVEFMGESGGHVGQAMYHHWYTYNRELCWGRIRPAVKRWSALLRSVQKVTVGAVAD